MIKKFVVAVFLFAIIFPIFQITEARSGCCSHHGGVIGCGCGDGTPLSSTCAPYYPECSRPLPTEIIYPTSTPTLKPTRIPTRKPTAKLSPKKKKVTPTPSKKPTKKSSKKVSK